MPPTKSRTAPEFVFDPPEQRAAFGKEDVLGLRPTTFKHKLPVLFSEELPFHLRKASVREFRNGPFKPSECGTVNVRRVAKGVRASSHSVFVLEMPPLPDPTPRPGLFTADITL